VTMNNKDFALALLMVALWGANFTVVKLGLDGVPPMLLAALRFAFAAFPAVFFVRRPSVKRLKACQRIPAQIVSGR